MDTLTLITIGILAGQAAAVLKSYSLGAIGNSLAGIAGSLLFGQYIALLFDFNYPMAMFAGGIAGALVILAVFDAAETLSRKYRH